MTNTFNLVSYLQPESARHTFARSNYDWLTQSTLHVVKLKFTSAEKNRMNPHTNFITRIPFTFALHMDTNRDGPSSCGALIGRKRVQRRRQRRRGNVRHNSNKRATSHVFWFGLQTNTIERAWNEPAPRGEFYPDIGVFVWSGVIILFS